MRRRHRLEADAIAFECRRTDVDHGVSLAASAGSSDIVSRGCIHTSVVRHSSLRAPGLAGAGFTGSPIPAAARNPVRYQALRAPAPAGPRQVWPLLHASEGGLTT